jgi:hypothetical protein
MRTTPEALLMKAIRAHADEKAREKMKEFENNSSQAERRRVLKEDQRSTYLDHARANAEMEAQGRFAKVTGSPVAGVPQVPRQPEGSPWHSDVSGIEPSLGYSVHDMVPTGTPSEVQASIAAELQRAIDEGSLVARAPDVSANDGPVKRRF